MLDFKSKKRKIIKLRKLTLFSFHLTIFSCPEQLNRWPCHWLTRSVSQSTLTFDIQRAVLETCDHWDIWSEWWGETDQKSEHFPKIRTFSKDLNIFWKSEPFQKSENFPKIWTCSENLNLFWKSEHFPKICQKSEHFPKTQFFSPNIARGTTDPGYSI